MFHFLKHANISFWRRKYYYDFDNLFNYVENVNIIRTKFFEHIKWIFKNVQKILIDWISKVLLKTLILIKLRFLYLTF